MPAARRSAQKARAAELQCLARCQAELPEPAPDPEEQAIAGEQCGRDAERMQTELSPLERSGAAGPKRADRRPIAWEKDFPPKPLPTLLGSRLPQPWGAHNQDSGVCLYHISTCPQ